MAFGAFDGVFIGAYFIISIGIAVYYTKKASKDTNSFFLGGRNMPWWLAGTSMVASTFAADTPLAVTELVAANGVAGNWIWWNMGFGSMLTVFFFARLWRRSGVLTDVEFIEFRYGGKPASFLRGFKAIYYGIFMNGLILGWVSLAMVTIFNVTFPGLSQILCFLFTFLIMGVAGISSSLSGLMGSVMTDFFQFFMAMTSCFILAVTALNSVGGLGAMKDVLGPSGALDFAPHILSRGNVMSKNASHVTFNSTSPSSSSTAVSGSLSMTVAAFLARVAVQWWAAWYPGGEPGGGGYIAQRMMAAKNETHSFFAMLWFTMAHYGVRSWPWILVGLAAKVKYGDLGTKSREGFVMMMNDTLGPGALGLLVAAFMAAYMSTVTTQLCWGTSYFVNDFWKRFVKPNKGEKYYVMVSRITTILLAVIALIITSFLESISMAWNIVISSSAGLGFVLILRWYWWRINGWSEIAAMITPMVLAIVRMIMEIGVGIEPDTAPWLLRDPDNLYAITALTIVATMVATFATSPESDDILDKFYEKVKPPGPGWRPSALRNSHIVIESQIWRLFFSWICSCVMVYCFMFFIGSCIFGRVTDIIATLAGLIVAGGILVWQIPKILALDEIEEDTKVVPLEDPEDLPLSEN